jgi:mannose-1-phosphate guanylyltransferase/phosphomannomutase
LFVKIRLPVNRMKAVILAGGKGTRMGEFTKEIPKPMLQVGGKPILEHQINLLHRYGFAEVFVLVNYLKDSIIDYFGNGEKFGITINYYEEKEPLGTVGGVKEIEELLTDDFLILYGDVMIDMHLGRLIEFHKNHKSECTLVLHPNDHPFDSDLVDISENHQVTEFFPKPHDSNKYYKNLVNAGAYIFSPIILSFLEKTYFLRFTIRLKCLATTQLNILKIWALPIAGKKWKRPGKVGK